MAEQTLLEKQEAGTSLVPKVEDASLPDWIKGENAVMNVTPRLVSPFVHIAQPKSTDFWNKLVRKFGDVQEGQAFMFFPGQEDVLRIEPFKFGLLLAEQFFVQANQKGEVLEARKKDPGKPYKERIIAAIATFAGDKIIPATVEFRSTKCAIVHSAINRLVEANDPVAWAAKSPEHALTMQLPRAFMRFVVMAQLSKRTSKSNGFNYALMTGETRPTGAGEWKLYKDLVEDPTSLAALNAVNQQYVRQVGELTAKLND